MSHSRYIAMVQIGVDPPIPECAFRARLSNAQSWKDKRTQKDQRWWETATPEQVAEWEEKYCVLRKLSDVLGLCEAALGDRVTSQTISQRSRGHGGVVADIVPSQGVLL